MTKPGRSDRVAWCSTLATAVTVALSLDASAALAHENSPQAASTLAPVTASDQVERATPAKATALPSAPDDFLPPDPPALAVTTIGNDSPCGKSASLGFGADGFVRCPFADSAVGITIRLQKTTPLGLFESYGVFARGSEGTLAPWRQIQTSQRDFGTETTFALVGSRASLLDDRLKLTTSLGRSEKWHSPLADAPVLNWRRDAGNASALLQRIELIPIARPGIRFTLSGQYSRVADNFLLPSAVALASSEFYLPGEHTQVSSTLKLKAWRLTARSDAYSFRSSSNQTKRISIAHSGLSLAYTLRKSSIAAGALLGAVASKTDGQSVRADFDLASLGSAMAGNRNGLAALIPTSVSLNLSKSDADTMLATGREVSQRKAWQAYGTWETRLGETSVGVERKFRRYLSGNRPDTIDAFHQMSHTVRWNGWRLGLDVSEMHQKAEGVRGFSDTSWSVGQSIAYSRKNGPEFRLRIGQDDTNVTFTDGSFANRFKSRQITMSLDMTAWLRHRFERPDLFLRLDYLRRFQSNEEEFESVADLLLQFQDRNTRQGLMLSYGMKFGKVR